MNGFKTKMRWTFGYSIRIFFELFRDLCDYFITPYPFLLILGAIRGIRRRLKIIWQQKPRGRSPIHENFVDLIIDLKRSNRLWGAQIYHELQTHRYPRVQKNRFKGLKTKWFYSSQDPFFTSFLEIGSGFIYRILGIGLYDCI